MSMTREEKVVRGLSIAVFILAIWKIIEIIIFLIDSLRKIHL